MNFRKRQSPVASCFMTAWNVFLISPLSSVELLCLNQSCFDVYAVPSYARSSFDLCQLPARPRPALFALRDIRICVW